MTLYCQQSKSCVLVKTTLWPMGSGPHIASDVDGHVWRGLH